MLHRPRSVGWAFFDTVMEAVGTCSLDLVDICSLEDFGCYCRHILSFGHHHQLLRGLQLLSTISSLDLVTGSFQCIIDFCFEFGANDLDSLFEQHNL